MMFLKGLFGGGSWGIYLMLATVMGGFLLERGHLKSRVSELKTEVSAANTARDSAIQGQLSMANTNSRRNAQDKESRDEEDALNDLPITRDCAQSKPITTVIGRMWNDESNRALGDIDGGDIQVPPNAESPRAGGNDRQ